MKNVECGPHLDHVETDPDYRYEPYFVKMHRCHGKDPVLNPRNEKCVPKRLGGTANVSVYVLNQLNKLITISVLNHTSCVQECVISQDNCSPYEHFSPRVCDCRCNYTSSQDGRSNCEAPFVWQQSACNCMCPVDESRVTCMQRKVFSKEECGCTCKAKFYARCAKRKQIVDQDTCHCIEPSELVGKSQSGCEGGVNGAMLAVVILVEAFVIVFCYYFFYAYCYKYNYLARKADKKKNVSSGYYHNGDIPNDTPNNGAISKQGNYGSSYDDQKRFSLTEDNTVVGLSDKELIHKEERHRDSGYHYPHGKNGYATAADKERFLHEDEEEERSHSNYCPGAPLGIDREHAPRDSYQDIMEVDGPPSSLENHNLVLPPDYSDAISDLSEDYGSVTQV